MEKTVMQKILNRKILSTLILMVLLAFSTGYACAKDIQKGTYSVVGVGPGDADLITPRALAAIQKADLVFCRSETREKLSGLVDFKGKQILEGYNVIFRYYGRDCAAIPEEERGRHKMTCEQYQAKQKDFAKLVREAVAAGKHAVLLSSGDPTIYGPDIWTTKELTDLNPVVVPGLSSFNAATAALKVSLGEVILTAPFQGRGGKDTIENLVKADKATLVIFMPRDMNDLFARLSANSPADTPVAVVSYAGHAEKELVITGTVADMPEKVRDKDMKTSLVYVGKALSKAHVHDRPAAARAKQGKFYLVGAGPGDSDLATLRALNVLKKADLIFAGTSISERFKKELAGKTVIEGFHRLFPFYGKKCAEVTEQERARERMSCEEYQAKQRELGLMVRQAVFEGKIVAMLDSGDPLVYGPCSWTLTEFKDLNTEVVPGLSCFNGANAAIGRGITEGESSHSVIFASGWTVDEMAAFQGTLVLFTMRTEFKKFIDVLSKHYAPDTPLAIVSSAGYAAREKVIRGTLSDILENPAKDDLPFEYMIYVGDFLK
jgi:precorrin-4 methylase